MTINVTFLNEDGAVITSADINSAQLPETFSIETKLHMSGNDWLVLSAKPESAKEFIATGKLTLVLKKVEMVDPKSILFTMPSLANALPEFAGGLPPDGQTLDIHEDLWRQNEFLDRSCLAAVQEDLQAIREIWEHNAVRSKEFTAFSKCHIRHFGDPALDISLHDVIDVLRSTNPAQLMLSGMPVINGFGLRADSGLYFGLADKGRVSVLCAETNDTDMIKKLMQKFDIAFIDWCGCLMMHHK